MKKFICAVLALVMVLSLAACGSKQDDNGGKTDVDLTAQEVLDKLKETLGDSYGCDAQLLRPGYVPGGQLGVRGQFHERP